MMLLPILVAAGLSSGPASVIQGIKFHQLQHGQNFRGPITQQGELYRSQANRDLAMRSAAFEHCAASSAQPLSESYGAAAIDQAKFEIIGSKYRDNGGIRVFVAASPAKVVGVRNLAKTVEISCDVDSRGNVRRMSLGKTD